MRPRQQSFLWKKSSTTQRDCILSLKEVSYHQLITRATHLPPLINRNRDTSSSVLESQCDRSQKQQQQFSELWPHVMSFRNKYNVDNHSKSSSSQAAKTPNCFLLIFCAIWRSASAHSAALLTSLLQRAQVVRSHLFTFQTRYETMFLGLSLSWERTWFLLLPQVQGELRSG
jgi:hypothetical protein